MPAQASAQPQRAAEPWQQLQRLSASQSARLLLVEDNPINREVALQLLHGSGLLVDTAANGAEAVEDGPAVRTTTWC